jgi:hypothetical protein
MCGYIVLLLRMAEQAYPLVLAVRLRSNMTCQVCVYCCWEHHLIMWICFLSLCLDKYLPTSVCAKYKRFISQGVWS